MNARVLYVAPLALGGNPAIDAIAYGLQHPLAGAGIDLSVLFVDFREPGFGKRYSEAISRGTAAGVDGIVIYTLDPRAFSEPVSQARSAGIPVFSFVRPHFPVDAAVVYPNFNHGTLMAEYLANRLPEGAEVAVIGGPDTVDDSEEVAGLIFALGRSHCQLCNDPEKPEYCNLEDVPSGGRAPAERILAEFPDLAGLIPYNDATMLGALPALEKAGRLGQLEIVSRNGSPEAIEAVRAGKTAGSWDLEASGIGVTLGDMVVRRLTTAEPRDELLAMTPVGRMITRENLGTWRPWEERIAWKPLREGV